MKHRDYLQDKYAMRAKKEGYRSRAALKLLDIHHKVKLFKPGMKVLDMGAAPGGWSQVVYKFIQPNGLIMGIDILPIEPYKNITFIQGDFNHDLPDIKFDVIISDICPNKTGNNFSDQCNMFDLCSQIVQILPPYLKVNGSFVCKFFYGEREQEFTTLLKDIFKNVKKLKPNSSRSVSSEFYYYCN